MDELDRALEVLDADAVDVHRHTMWRYGVRHTLTVIRDALAARSGAELLLAALVTELVQSAPIKVEGGSPARRQWLRDVIAVQGACHSVGLDDVFVALMNDDDMESGRESGG